MPLSPAEYRKLAIAGITSGSVAGRIYALLADRCAPGYQVRLTIAELTRTIRKSERTIQYGLRSLKQAGLLKLQSISTRGGVYALPLREPEPEPAPAAYRYGNPPPGVLVPDHGRYREQWRWTGSRWVMRTPR